MNYLFWIFYLVPSMGAIYYWWHYYECAGRLEYLESFKLKKLEDELDQCKAIISNYIDKQKETNEIRKSQ